MNGAVVPAALIFDWDNTLVDTWATTHEAINLMLPQIGNATWSMEETRRRLHRSARDAFPALFGTRWKEAVALYHDAYKAIHLKRLRPLPGAEALIAGLHAEGRLLALVSNKVGSMLREEVKALDWGRYFTCIVGAGDAERDKPDRAPIDLVLNGTPHRAGKSVWFVGDTDIDIECALNADCVPVLLRSDAPSFDPSGEYHRARPARHYPNCAALALAIMAEPNRHVALR